MDDEDWKDDAACRGAGAPGCRWWSGSIEVHAELEPICRTCPVYNKCLNYGYKIGMTGVYMAGRWWG